MAIGVLERSATGVPIVTLCIAIAAMAAKPVEPLQEACNVLRDKKGVPWGVAKLEEPEGEGERREFFRGKDLVRFVEANPGKLEFALKKSTGACCMAAAWQPAVLRGPCVRVRTSSLLLHLLHLRLQHWTAAALLHALWLALVPPPQGRPHGSRARGPRRSLRCAAQHAMHWLASKEAMHCAAHAGLHPEAPLLLPHAADRTPQEQAADLARALLSRGLIIRTERKFKRPKPGRTRLVKWPRTLLLVKVWH